MKRRRTRTVFPPCVVGQMDDYEWFPANPKRPLETQAHFLERGRQNRLAKLRKMDAAYSASELQYLRRRCEALSAVVQADNEWLEQQRQREAEVDKIKQWYLTEQDKERLARLKHATDTINKDIVKSEREELLKRGVVRGKRKRLTP